MNNETYIDVNKFSNDPWGRDASDNPDSSGELFRQTCLVNAFQQSNKVTVDFSHLEMIPDSGFIGEAFVGLVKKENFSYKEVYEKLKVLPEDGFYPNLVFRILDLAKKEEIELGILNE